MESVICKNPVVDFSGSPLFLRNKTYKVVGGGKNSVLIKDELNCIRHIALSDKFFKDHFKENKGEST